MGWLKKVGNAVSSTVGTVGDVVEGVGDAVVETGKDIINSATDGIKKGFSKANGWLCKVGGKFGCRFGNFVFGGLSGFFEGFRDVTIKALDATQSALGIVGSLLRGDFAGVIGGIVNLGIELFEFGINVVRLVIGGTVIGGIRDHWQAEDLRDFVRRLVNDRYKDDIPRLGQAIANLGLNNASWGLDMDASHRVFKLSSFNTPLWQWHNDGDIDLFALAGLFSSGSFTPGKPIHKVRAVNRSGNVSVESGIPINRWQLSNYIDSNGEDGEIVVYAFGAHEVKDRIQLAISKCKKLGINLNWDDGKRFQYATSNFAHLITEFDEYRFVFGGTRLGNFLVDNGFKNSPDFNQCHITALAGFRLMEQDEINGVVSNVKRRSGLASGRTFKDGDSFDPCEATPKRTDSCCATIDNDESAGVMHTSRWPSAAFRYVLAHEIGHYLGLCHYGHDGVLHNIMYTKDPDADLSMFDAGDYNFLLDNEPSFSHKDAKNVWRFLIAHMSDCITGPMPDDGPIVQ